ncbi:MAG: peptide ABC transporter substrate-binding protein [Anaerolineales bacterium]|jgi:oligopeptide transport system substrate-binding protein
MYLKRNSLLGFVLLLSMILGACAGSGAPETVIVTVEGEGGVETVIVTATPQPEPVEPVTYYGADLSDIPTLDPQIGEDVTSINYVENLFMNLTNVDVETNEIVPEAATSWDISADGLTYTFTLRTDIPWVRHNPVTGETIQEVDADGNPRFLTAYDFEYGIKRACDPAIGSYYSSVIAPTIKGCSDYLFAETPTPELYDAIGVVALDESLLQINLEFPAAFFITMTPMWTLAATPQWAIEENGENWIEAGNIVTNGRYVLHEWVHNNRRIMTRNPLLPEDLRGEGNVERHVVNVVPDQSTAYALWLNADIDYFGAVPDEELQAQLQQFPDETAQIADLTTFYIAFRMSKAPFDNVHVRRAFSMAFDKQLFIDTVRQGQGIVMNHFTGPGIFGAPPMDEVGQGFDAELAREELAEAGYPNCEGFPPVTLLGYSGQNTLNWIEYAAAQWQENLGCDASRITIEQLPFSELLAGTKASSPDEDVPHMWTLGWGPDYADANNMLGDVLWCEGENRSKRSCNELDDLIIEARLETDPATRVELYRELEDGFFGREGEFPLFPIFLRIQYAPQHSWLNRPLSLFGGQQVYNYIIDQTAQLAARG